MTISDQNRRPGSISDQPVDITNCDREPIHIPGSIQPHGALLAFTECDRLIASASANLALFGGPPIPEIAGSPLAELLDSASHDRVLAALRTTEATGLGPVPVQLANGAQDLDLLLDGLLHRQDGLVFLELEPRGAVWPDAREYFRRTSSAIRRLQAADGLIAACQTAAREVREITGFDRVKVYRFAADWSGEVIAENRCAEIGSFLGLHFPPSDIPAQARALYARNSIRIIPDIQYRPVPLVPDLNPLSGRPIDLSQAVLRSVSPLHLEYMQNMGVLGTMSVSIMRGDRLWGLIACHNRVPRHVGPDLRQACDMLAQVLAWQIGLIEEADVARRGLQGKTIQRRLLGDIERLRDHRAGLMRSGEALLELMGATGLCLFGGDGATTVGLTPPGAEIERLAEWLARSGQEDLFQTDRLSTLFPEAAAYAGMASGVLAVPLSRSAPRRLMFWFRPEVAQTVTWGGDPHKPTVLGPNGKRLLPRMSFEAWRQEVRGRSRPWESHEVAAAMEIRDLVIDVILRKSEELERVNTQLARSNEELESFAYVASHDLKEPLRHIEAFAGLLSDWISGEGNERLVSMVSGIETSSRRLRNLINDLAEYSRLGRQAQPLEVTNLQEILDEVLFDLRQRIEESSATVQCDGLPVVMCDRNQMRQVLQNLLSNALKYRHPTRAPLIRIRAEEERGETRHGTEVPGLVHISVEDNGIGFDDRYRDQVFEPFQRLHGPDEYEGSGIGLAICRKIVQRHGGTIGVETTVDGGANFWFTLPHRPAREGV